MILTGLDTALFLAINDFARATPWLQPLVRRLLAWAVQVAATTRLRPLMTPEPPSGGSG